MKTLKSFRCISVSITTVSLLLFALACGGDSDDDDSNETGGTTAATGGTDTASGGTTAATGGSGGGMDAAAQLDGADAPPTDVTEGGECTMSTMLFSATGTCSSSKDCPGGLPTQFDISGIGIDPMIAAVLETPTSDQANCASGLTCCVNTDQCNAVGSALSSNPMVETVLGDSMGSLSIQCVAEGGCSAINEDSSFGELSTGCESGQVCCVNIPPITLPEAGIIPTEGGVATTDAATQAGDASSE